jgi:hypothetical protein
LLKCHFYEGGWSYTNVNYSRPATCHILIENKWFDYWMQPSFSILKVKNEIFIEALLSQMVFNFNFAIYCIETVCTMYMLAMYVNLEVLKFPN